MFGHYNSLFLTAEEKPIMIHHEAELVKAPDFLAGVAALYTPTPPSQVLSLTFLEDSVEEQQSPPS